jgi:hypothetical protein
VWWVLGDRARGRHSGGLQLRELWAEEGSGGDGAGNRQWIKLGNNIVLVFSLHFLAVGCLDEQARWQPL